MALLKIRDADGNVQEILALKGEKGDKGDPGEFTGGELLNAHIADKNNPHGATAEQIGARPDTWMPTAAEVGAAPAGYGLGTAAGQLITSVADLDEAILNGWYRFSCAGSQLGGVTLNYASVFVTSVSPHGIWQEIRPINSNVVISRQRTENVWSPWEIENPPMMPGVEYRTTKRYNGKPVYAKLVSYQFSETISATGNETVEYRITNCISNREVGWMYEATADHYPLPFSDSNGHTFCKFDGNDIVVCLTNHQWTAEYVWRFWCEYTKTTD